MSERYIFRKRDQQVVQAVERLLKQLVRSEVLEAAKLVSVAKVLHVLSRLPRVTENVCVSVELAFRVEQAGCSSSSIWQFSVGSDWLNLSVGGSEYTEGVGSDSFTTMTWSAQPGERTDYDGSWDESWMQQDEGSETAVHSENFRGCSISVDDDDNELLFAEESNDEEEPDPWLELSREDEKVKLKLSEWRAAIREFKESGWEPAEDFEKYGTPGITVSAEDGAGMRKAGDLTWRLVDQTPVLIQSFALDFDLFLSLMRFVGRGQFSVKEVRAGDGQ